jgi:cell division protein FtsL
LLPLAVLGVVAVVGWALYPAVQLQYQTSRRVGSLEQQYDTLRSRNNKLRQEVSAMGTAAGVEDLARNNLGLGKPNETVFVVVPSGSSTSGSKPATSAPPARSMIQSFLDAVFGVTASADATHAP